MGIITLYGNYVKFLRGTPNAYNQSEKDDDTLYFVCEKNADHGVLYLGEKLISGSLSASTSLEDLSDVLIGANIDAGSLLYYDGEKWVNKSLSEIFEIIVGTMVGATENLPGSSGLVPTPGPGMLNMYLRGDATWANPVASLEITVNQMANQVGTLIGNDTDKSAREIAQEEVSKIVDNAPEAFDTLREISLYLIDHPAEAGVAQRLTALEDAIFTTTTGLEDRTLLVEVAINNLNDELESLRLADELHDELITNIQIALQALKWQKMIVV